MKDLAVKAVAAAAMLTACGGIGGPHHDGRGNAKYVTVVVDTDANLRAVFDSVAADLTDDLVEPGGYFIAIDCATGEHNRLGNGRKAVGAIGAAVTGLKAGESVFEPLPGRTCPAR